MKVNKKKKIRSIFGLAIMGMGLFMTILDFKFGEWTWGLLSAALLVIVTFKVISGWAWNTESDVPDNNDKTKDLKDAWRDKF